MKSRLLSFRILPASWGLSGQSYKLAEIDYYHDDGIEKDRAKANVLYEGAELKKQLLDINFRYNLISKQDYELSDLMLKKDTMPEIDYNIAMANVQYDHGKISKNEYEKTVACLRNEPWVSVVDVSYDPELGPSGAAMELDWNDAWIELLRNNGYSGQTDEDVMEVWYADVCRYALSDEGVSVR